MNSHLLVVIFTLVVATGWSKHCPNKSSISNRSNSNKLICYYSKLSDVDSCFCSHVILPANSDVKSVENVKKQMHGVKVFVTVSEFNEGLIKLLKSNNIDGLEIKLQKLNTKHDISDFISTVSTKIGSELDIFLSVPAKAELLAKYFDFKALSKHVDAFILETAFLGVSKNVTFHPSRLSGLWDMQNTDSVVDLVTGMGAPISKLVITAPVQGFAFTLQDEDFTAPGSPAVELKTITRDELCEIIDRGGKNWTLERDEDQAGPYIFSKTQWISFEDHKSIDIKAKYARVRGLAGMALKDVSMDGSIKCNKSILETAFNGLSRQARAPRGAVLHSLEREILETPNGQSQSVNLSPFRISRIIDTEGHIHVVRQDTRTEFQCSRQGYFVHPRSCNRFYRCVKFDQLVDDFNVFEFDCPAGLAFDERVEVCVWPGSLPHGTPCAGSSEIAPVPRQRFDCPSEPGYYADPENCRWFFACLDHGQSRLAAYEFRCPFGLVFDGEKLLCEWPWLVPKCSDGLGGEYRSTYVYGGPSGANSFNSAVILDHYNGLGSLGTVRLGGIAEQIEKPVARIYSNAGLEGNQAIINGYQNKNGYIEGSGLSYQAAQSLQNAGLLKINNGAGVAQAFPVNLVGVADSANIQYSGGLKSQNQNLHTFGLNTANAARDINLQNAGVSGYGSFVNTGDAGFKSGNTAADNLDIVGVNQVYGSNNIYSLGNNLESSKNIRLNANNGLRIDADFNTFGELGNLKYSGDENGAVSSQSFAQHFGSNDVKPVSEYQPIQYVTSRTVAPIPVSIEPQTTILKTVNNNNLFTPLTNVKIGLSSIDGNTAGQYQYGFAQTVKPVQHINTKSYEISKSDYGGLTQNQQNGYVADFGFTNPKFVKISDQYQGGILQSSAPVYETKGATADSLGSTGGAVSTSSFTQYHGGNNQDVLVNKFVNGDVKTIDQYRGRIFQSSTPVYETNGATAGSLGSTGGAVSTSSFTQYHGNNQDILVNKFVNGNLKTSDQYQGGIFQSSTPVYETKGTKTDSLRSTGGAVSTSSFTQYHGGNSQDILTNNHYNGDVYRAQNENYGQGVAGSINIIGRGYSAVGVPRVEISNHEEKLPVSFSTISTTVPTVTKVPVPGIKTVTSFQSINSGVIANVPEFQYKVQSNGDFGLRNVSTKFVNFVRTSPTPLTINHGLQYASLSPSLPVESVTESTGYVYKKPKITFQETTKLAQQGYVYERPSIPFEETPIKSIGDVTVSGYSDVTSTARPLVTVQPQTVYVSTTQTPPTIQTIVKENQGYIYNTPSVAFTEGVTERPIISQHILQPTIQPVTKHVVQPLQPTVSTYLVNNVNTSLNQVGEIRYQPQLLVQPQIQYQPDIYVQPQVKIQQQGYQPQEISIQRVERPHEPVIISKFSIRKPVEQQTYYFEKPQVHLQQQPLEVVQPVVHQQQIQIQQPKVEVGYEYPKPAIRFELPSVKSEYVKVSTPVPTYQQPYVEVTTPAPTYQPSLFEVRQPPLPQVVRQPIFVQKTEKEQNFVEFYQHPIVEAPRPFIQKSQQDVIVQQTPKIVYYNQQPKVQQVEQTFIEQPRQRIVPEQRIIIEPPKQQIQIIKEQPVLQPVVEQKILEQPEQRIVPFQEQHVVIERPRQQVQVLKEQPRLIVTQQSIHYQQPVVVQKEVVQIPQQPQVSTPRPVVQPFIHTIPYQKEVVHIQQQPQVSIASTPGPVVPTYLEQPKLAIVHNQYTPYTYQNIAHHAAVVKTQTPKPDVVVTKIQTSTFRPVISSTYNYVDSGEVPTPKYEIYKTPINIESSTGYSYPKPAVKFEEIPRPVVEVPFVKKTAYVTGQQVNTGYRNENPSVDVVEGYKYPKPAVRFEEERRPVEEVPFVKKTAYVTGQQVQPVYRYEKPLSFEHVPIVTEDYKISDYEKVKQTVFGSKLYVPSNTENILPSTSRPVVEIKYSSTPQVYKTVIPSTTTRYVETTSTPLIKYNQVYAQQENGIGYDYPKPAVGFKEGGTVIENYQYPEYEKVKQNLFGTGSVPSTQKPTFYTTIATIGQKLQPLGTISSTEQARAYYTTTTENYPSNYEILKEKVRYQAVPTTTPCAHETPVYSSVTVPSVVSSTSRPIARYSFSSLDNNNYQAENNKLSVQQEGYIYPKPSVTFEEGAKVIENYEFPQYEKVKQRVFTYTTPPRPTLQTIITTPFRQQSRTYYSTTSGTTTTNKPIITYTRYNPISSTTPLPSTVKVFSSSVPTLKVVEDYNAPEITTLSRDYLPIKSIITPTSKIDVTTYRPRGRIATTIKLAEPEVTKQPSREYLPVKSRVRVTTTTPKAVEEEISEDYEIRKLGPVRTIVKQNGYHPMLSAKLGAQCLCISDSLRLTNKKGRKLKILVVDEDGNAVNDDSVTNEDDDGYVVEGDIKGKMVENYEYRPDGELEITPRPVSLIKSTTEDGNYVTSSTIATRNNIIRVRPASTTEIYSTPVTDARELFIRTKTTSLSYRSRVGSRYEDSGNSVSDAEIATAVRTGLKLVKQAAKDGAWEGTEDALQKSFDRYGPGGVRSRTERLQGTVDCKRAGLFRHPTECNKFYACRWDCNKNRFTLHVFNCPVHLTFDNNLGACNWPSQGPACVDNTLITSD